MLRPLDTDLWVIDESFAVLGFQVGARTTIVRMPDGAVWVHSPSDLTPEIKQEIDAIGQVKWLVSPNNAHYLDLKRWADAYPAAKVFTVPKLKKVEGVTIERHLGTIAEPEWAGTIEQTLFLGSVVLEEAVFCHRPSRTLLVGDVAFNIPSTRGALTTTLARFLGVLNRLSPSLLIKLSIQNKKAARESIETILKWDFDRVIVSHGEVCDHGKKQLRQNYDFLGLKN